MSLEVRIARLEARLEAIDPHSDEPCAMCGRRRDGAHVHYHVVSGTTMNGDATLFVRCPTCVRSEAERRAEVTP